MSAVVINIDTALTNVPTIEVGKQGENGATQVVFDVSEMIETYGSGTAYVVVQRRGDAEPYLLDNTSQSGDKVTWTVSNVDTDVYGTGRVQLFWLINEQVAKTVTYQFYVEEALHDPQDAPVVPGGWISDEIGNLDNLTTTAKANLVAAINEVNSKAATNTTSLGTLANLTTTEKSNLVGAINEVNEDVSDVKEDLAEITPYSEKVVNTGQFEAYYVNNGVWGANADSISAIIPMQTGATYSVEAFGTHNRFRIYVSNSIEEGTRPTEVYRSEPIHEVTGDRYTYTNTDGYKYLLCFMNYSVAYNITSFSVTEKRGNTADDFSVNGVRVYTASEVNEQIDNATPYTSAKEIELMTGIVAQTGEIKHGESEDATGRLARFKVEPNKYYQISAKADILNRFIIYGSSNPNRGYSELYRVQVGTVTSSESYTIQNTAYNYFAIFLYHGNDGSAFSCEFSAYESDVSPLEQFTVNGVKVYTTEQTDEFLSAKEQKYYLRSENIKLPSSGMESAPTNLCLAAVKSISVQGNIPDVEGYLYFDDITRKFYYSSGTPYNPVFVFDWDLSLADQEHPKRWQATITADGDVIFLKYHAKHNPIVYPHGDYEHPYLVDFGSNRKPYGWLVNSSVVQFADGSFVFGDYAAHSLTDEQNDDRRIIWKVTKPYSLASNWSQEHSFKHVYYTSSKSNEPDNEIGHIHAIMFDHYDGYLYCTTGDIDRHCRMWISTDLGVTWAAVPNAVGTTEDTTVQAVGQKWRMTNGIFTADAMWWATDAMRPYHKLWKCTRDANGHIDFSTLEEVVDVEIFGLTSAESQRTYITALCRNPDGLLLIDRGEPRGDKLNFTFYDFETGKLHIVSEYERATNSVGDLEAVDRIGLPMQCTTPYMPQCIDGIVTGGGQLVRPNNTNLFNNSVATYVGAIKLVLT